MAGLAVVAGHTWPLFHGFAGGDGLAPAAGVLLAVSPWTLLISLTLLALLASILGRADHAELLAIALMPAVTFLAERGRLDALGIAIGLACFLIAARWRVAEVLLGARKAEEEEEEEEEPQGPP
ncbi:MAG: glycerol-3-phosphate acyltransferase [bacterium]